MANQVDRLEDDVAELKAWTTRHDEEHTADTRLLASIMDAVREHSHNAHGIRSRATQVGSTGLLVAFLGVVLEVIRRLVF
jgi:hypothetical protein